VKLKIGKIPYLNSVLFYHRLESNPETLTKLRFVPMVPRRLSTAATGNQIDAGPVPLVTSFELSDTYEPLGDFCIATINKAMSILLFSQKPPEMLDHSRIGITHETSTSVRLLKVLFAHHYCVTPHEYVSTSEPNQASLLIGDAALRNRAGCEGYPYTTDLGEVWHRATGLPFVFAVWMVRRSLPDDHKAYIRTAVSEALDEGWTQLDEAVGDKLDALGMTRAEAREYLEGFRFRMDAPSEQRQEVAGG
jgi:chorismate dehydratase